MSQFATPSALKQTLRKDLRAQRRAHVESLPEVTRALIFSRPPAPVAALVPEGATVGLYQSTAFEAPTGGYARWFHENGHPLALPQFTDRQSPMVFRPWADPYDPEDLEPGPWGALQPPALPQVIVPDVVFMPLLGFTAEGHRLGQGGGHYDRWLAAHPGVIAIGLAWDIQLRETLPVEPHDRPLAAVVTPTRIYLPGDREGQA